MNKRMIYNDALCQGGCIFCILYDFVYFMMHHLYTLGGCIIRMHYDKEDALYGCTMIKRMHYTDEL